MSNIPQPPQNQMNQHGQGSLLTIIAGVAAEARIAELKLVPLPVKEPISG